jgi:hypothetical protein
VLNGNAIESEATRKSRIQDGVRSVMAEIMQIGRIFQGRYVWRGNVKVYLPFIEEGTICSFTFYIFYAQKCINCRNLLIYDISIYMCIFKNINLILTVVECRHWQVVLGSTFLEKERYFHICPRS